MQRDLHYRKAKAEGYRARSAYKLLELLEVPEVGSSIRDARRVLDLCAAPGSWSQVVRNVSQKKKAGTQEKEGQKETDENALEVIVAVDISPIEPMDGVHRIQGDITEEKTVESIKKALRGKADLVLCDGAPEVTGLHDLDDYFQSALIQASCGICRKVLAPSGTFVTKVFTGGSLASLTSELQERFEEVSLIKPQSSRVESKEAFAICRKMKADR